VACFTKCCRNIDILLTPYDVIRLKNRLGISSTDFLAAHTRYEIDEKTTHPMLFMRMNDDGDRYCPFVKPIEGCTIYTDRPAACRYYPVGQATHRRMDDKNENPIHDEFYIIVIEDHCLGFKEDKVWTIEEWREDQAVVTYDEMNREWKNMMMKQDIAKDKIDDKRQQMFYMASYDIDSFRRFVFESKFLEVVDVDAERLEKMRNDEIALLQFGFDYIKYLYGIKNPIKVKVQPEETS
jgi:Fe-S-cluster containining protein